MSVGGSECLVRLAKQNYRSSAVVAAAAAASAPATLLVDKPTDGGESNQPTKARAELTNGVEGELQLLREPNLTELRREQNRIEQNRTE